MKYSFKLSKYRVCFQTKNKVWIYKNSRLRNFYKFRSKIVLRFGRFARKFLITKNMKWTVARRQMVPYSRKKHYFSKNYKNIFFTKQRIKKFYGGLKEYQIRNFFKKTWNKSQIFRTNIFLSSLEQRVGMLLFRMRLLPTVYVCNQLIMHKGIFVNNYKIMVSNYKVKLGDIIAIPNEYWFIFFEYLYERLYYRYWGLAILTWRKFFFLKKIRFYRLKKKFVYIKNFHLIKKFNKQKKRAYLIIKYLKFLILKLEKKNTLLNLNKYIYFICVYFKKHVTIKIKQIKKYLWIFKQWIKWNYLRIVNFIITKIFSFRIFISKFYGLILNVLFFVIAEKKTIFLNEFEKEKFKFLLNKTISRISTRQNSSVWYREFKYYRKIFRFFYNRLKKKKHKRSKYLNKNKRYFRFLLRKWKYRKRKRKKFKNWYPKFHWFVPKYLEIDYITLRVSMFKYPEISQIFFGFPNSFKKIISFYKEKAL
jgi:ribosomal protein S4